MSTVVEEIRLIWSDPVANHNKAWHGTLFENGDVMVEWGRVGAKMQTKTHSGAGERKLRTLEGQKLKKGYTVQRTVSGTAAARGSGQKVAKASLRDQAIKDIGGNPEVQKLVGWLAEINVHAITANTQITYDVNTGTFSTPLGLVDLQGIAEARGLLDRISKGIREDGIDADPTQGLIGDYCRIIPTKVAARRGWHRQLFGASDSLRKQNDILDSLDASLATARTAKPTEKTAKKDSPAERVFEVTLDIVTDLEVSREVKGKFKADRGHHYDVANLDIKRIFAVRIPTIADAFENRGKKVGNVRRLWHGTKASNLLSILKVGLVIPPSSSGHVTGRMFGDGLYFSDQSTKSLRYATNAWSHGGDVSRTFMFLCDVAMGKEHVPSGSNWSFRLPRGYDSCFAKSGRSGVANNEMIVYNTAQANLVWLIEFTPHGR